MTKEFDKAKAETIEKWNGVLGAVKMAIDREIGRCSFCREYGDCEECPARELCLSALHCHIVVGLKDVRRNIREGISLLKKMKEMPVARLPDSITLV